MTIHSFYGPDIWYHLFLGRGVLSQGVPSPTDNLLLKQDRFRNIYWLFQLLCEGVYSNLGLVGLGLLFTAAWLGCAYFWVRTADVESRKSWILLPIAAASLFICQVRFEHRPEIFSYLFLMMMLNELSKSRDHGYELNRRVARLAVVQIIWTNVHGYFALGPLLVLAHLIHAYMIHARPAVRNLLKILAVVVVCSWVSPLGWKTWVFVYDHWILLGEMRNLIVEFRPAVGSYLALWTVWIFWIYWLASIIALVFVVLIHKRQAVYQPILAAAGLWLSFQSLRNLPLLPLMMAPLIGLVVKNHFNVNGVSWRFVPRGIAVGSLAMVVWVVHGGFHRSLDSESQFGMSLSSTAYPIQFSKYFKQHEFKGKLLNVSADGGYLEYHHPDLILYADSRFSNGSLVKEYFSALVDRSSFDRLQARHRFDGTLLRVSDNFTLVKSLLIDPDWSLAYADLHRVFFINRASSTGMLQTRELDFYDGEDLSFKPHGMSAIRWVMLSAETGRRDLLIAALNDFYVAEEVPSFVVEFAGQFAQRTGDREVLALAKKLLPKIVALQHGDRRSAELAVSAEP